MRLNCTSRIWAIVLTISVLARPGTPTSRQCPPVKMAARICSMTSSCPTIDLVQLLDHQLAMLFELVEELVEVAFWFRSHRVRTE